MPSVVGILGHLAQQHGHNIKTALLQLFKDSIESDPDSMQIMTVPYLLHLASMSPLLLRVISTEFLTALTPHNLNMLCQQSTYWHSKNKQDINSLLNLLVHLLMKCEDQTFEIIMFLLNSSQQAHISLFLLGDGCQVNPLVQRACTIILSKVLLDLERQILSKHDNEKEIVLLSSLKPHVERLCLKLVESTDTRCKRWLIQILACVGWYNGLACVNHILAFLLLNISTESQLGVFIQLQREIEIRLPAVLLNIMSTLSLLTGKGTTSSADVYKLLRNLTTIVKWENESKTPLTRCQFKECIIKNMATFASFFSDGDLETGIQCLHLLNMIDLPGNLETVTLVTLARSCVATLFSICSTAGDTDEGYKNKQRNTDTLCAYVTKLSESTTAYRYIQRTLLTQLLTKENVPLFGHKQDQASFSSSSKSTPTSLFEELQKTQRESTVAHHHGGIIGQGKRVHTQDDSFTQDDQATNRLCALRVLWATCCRRTDNESAGGASQVIGEHLHHLSNLMVELVTPDACYNEIPWPDEDLMKVTLERDLYIKKQFDTKPILWDIMELISFDHLAIAKSSPLLRGLVAVQVNYWVSCRDKNTTDSPQSEQYLRESNRLLEFMAKGNLLPQPLCFIAEFFRHVSPFKVFLLLTNVWAFIKENPDNLTSETPTLLPGCATNFMALIQNLMHADIDKLGHYYPLFFQKT
ncbi:unnamed protein product [Owenia fusiformis]|uniref:Uncharacterized protein n=1 Tax=Owenia fusiformis TaxID=6347 RepID=A0A8J1UWK7_OWEFU|nr:unnamed protein product [Owenia fusiformis]